MVRSEIPPADEIEGRIAKTTVTSFRLIEALQHREEAGVSELADELDIWKGTAHKHLVTLQKLGYVSSNDGKYRLNVAFLGLGASVRSRMTIYRISQSPLERLAEATGEVASVMIPEQGWGVYLSRVSTEAEEPSDLYEGERVPLTATAGGKAILSSLPDAEKQAVFEERQFPKFTERMITDRAELEEELRRIRDGRMARDRGEFDPDRYCVASPITDAEGVAIAAVTVSGTPDRMSEKRERMDFGSILGSTATSIESKYRSNT